MAQLIVRPDEPLAGKLENDDAQSLVFDDAELAEGGELVALPPIEIPEDPADSVEIIDPDLEDQRRPHLVQFIVLQVGDPHVRGAGEVGVGSRGCVAAAAHLGQPPVGPCHGLPDGAAALDHRLRQLRWRPEQA